MRGLAGAAALPRELKELADALDRILVRIRRVQRVALTGGHRELYIFAGRAADETLRAMAQLEAVRK